MSNELDSREEDIKSAALGTDNPKRGALVRRFEFIPEGASELQILLFNAAGSGIRRQAGYQPDSMPNKVPNISPDLVTELSELLRISDKLWRTKEEKEEVEKEISERNWGSFTFEKMLTLCGLNKENCQPSDVREVLLDYQSILPVLRVAWTKPVFESVRSLIGDDLKALEICSNIIPGIDYKFDGNQMSIINMDLNNVHLANMNFDFLLIHGRNLKRQNLINFEISDSNSQYHDFLNTYLENCVISAKGNKFDKRKFNFVGSRLHSVVFSGCALGISFFDSVLDDVCVGVEDSEVSILENLYINDSKFNLQIRNCNVNGSLSFDADSEGYLSLEDVHFENGSELYIKADLFIDNFRNVSGIKDLKITLYGLVFMTGREPIDNEEDLREALMNFY